ncbi:MAG: M1 family metallopeptidase [Candidatus Binataceae bacterium]
MHYHDSANVQTAAEVYRLPATVRPEHYEIRLEPDLRTFTFAGEETVAIEVLEPVEEIQLNALELEIDEVTVSRDGESHKGKTELDPVNERAILNFGTKLKPGKWALKIRFRGILNDKLHGFYRSQYKDTAGQTHMVASTQFEATDARRAIPCWDEPAAKATFQATLVIDQNLAAISNTAIEHERALGNGKKEVTFHKTIKMSTYLLAFVVGEFKATDPVDAGGVPLRVWYVPGKEALTPYALEIGAFSLKFFANYYGIKYPGDKLDLIAIPDFAAGAMENLGAITFRETALLVDQKTASRAELERVADVVSHENAHMWFGDLVTMKWWNGIWLNEAFATFMEMLAVDAWKPQWERWVSFGLSRGGAMAVDGLKSTRSIEYPVHSPADAGGMFDVLTYEKGASVLRMLEQFLGAEEFRKGISQYLRKHEYANTETGDLWDALEQASHQPVRKMMDSWIFQPGFPIIGVAKGADGHSVKLSQSRFLYAPGAEKNTQLWDTPLMIKAVTGKGVSEHKLLLTSAETTLELPGAVKWVVVNEGGHGFYRVRYSSELLAAVTGQLDKLSAIERFGLVSDTWAAVVAGIAPLSDFFKMAATFRNETDLNVWRAILAGFGYLDNVVDETHRPALQAEVRRLVSPAVERLGWEPKPGESELQSQLRGSLIGALGVQGDDPQVQKRARELYARYKHDPGSVDNNLVPALIGIVAHTGGEADYREFKERFKSAKTPQEEQRYLYALADFRRPEFLRDTMQMTLNGEVRTQNAPYLMMELLMNTECRYEAWAFMKQHWDKMSTTYPENALPRMCGGITSLVDQEADVDEFFKAHKVKQGGKTVEQHLERLHIAVGFKKREIASAPADLGIK